MRYRRALIEGATYFFTVNLVERSSRLLVERSIDWQFSSFHRHLRFGWVTADWGCVDDFDADFGERR
jgi:hypothetical protein